jgi:hypothetical protein
MLPPRVSDVVISRDAAMRTLTNLAIGSRQMHILLVAENQEDFIYLRDLLVRAGDGHIALDHAQSSEEALALLR